MDSVQTIGEKTLVNPKCYGKANAENKAKQKVWLKKIKAKFKFHKNILHFTRRLKWDWAGHLGRLKDNCWTTKIIF